jgi:hypothetical protein
MTVADCKPGDIIETVHFGIPSGNIYRIGQPISMGASHVKAWREFKQGRVNLHKSNPCRIVTTGHPF